MSRQSKFLWDIDASGIRFALDPTALAQLRQDISSRGEYARGLLIGVWTGGRGQSRCVISECLPFGEAGGPTRDLRSYGQQIGKIIDSWPRHTPEMPTPVGLYSHYNGDVDDFETREFSKVRPYLVGGTELVFPGDNSSGARLVAGITFAACIRISNGRAEGEIAAVQPRQGIIARTPITFDLTARRAENPAKTFDIVEELRAAAQQRPQTPPQDTNLPAADLSEPKQHVSKIVAGRSFEKLRAPRRIRGAYVGTAIALAVAFALANVWWSTPSKQRLGNTAAQIPGPHIVDLRTKRTSGTLEITWDPHSPTARAAENAILHIEGAGQGADLPLADNERKNGRVVYKPKAGDVNVRVDFFAAGKTIGSGSVPARDSFDRERSRTGTTVPDAPPSVRKGIGFPPLSEQATVKTVPIPIPIENAPISVPAELRAAMTTTVTIPVFVTVDENGYVSKARVGPQRDGANTQLAAIALEAAKNWRFKPATQDGKRVSSPYVLSFRFER